MSDTALNRFISYGTDAERIAFVPDPPTVAAGAALAYLWFTSDTLTLYSYDFGAVGWAEIAGGGGASFSGAQLQLSANQVIGTAANVTISWDVENYDVGGYWTVGDPTHFVIPSDGKYHATVNIRFNSAATGIVRGAGIRYDGAGVAFQSNVALNPGGTVELNASVDIDALATKKLNVFVYQDSSGNLDVLGGASGAFTRFSIHKIG